MLINKTSLVKFLLLISLTSSLIPGVVLAKTDYNSAWNTTLKSAHFGNKAIAESTDIIELTTPYRAEDAASVPISITSKIPQTADRYIKTITLFIDLNPEPLAAVFHFTPDSGKADVAMRVRVNTYTNMRAIAELNDGSLSMHTVFIKASGGCSAPLGADLEAAMKRLGKIKFRKHDVTLEKPSLAEMLISHPQCNRFTDESGHAYVYTCALYRKDESFFQRYSDHERRNHHCQQC